MSLSVRHRPPRNVLGGRLLKKSLRVLPFLAGEGGVRVGAKTGTSGLSQRKVYHPPAGTLRLAALLLGRILPVCSLVAPCQPGVAARTMANPSLRQSTRSGLGKSARATRTDGRDPLRGSRPPPVRARAEIGDPFQGVEAPGRQGAEERADREFVSDEQRSRTGCIGGLNGSPISTRVLSRSCPRRCPRAPLRCYGPGSPSTRGRRRARSGPRATTPRSSRGKSLRGCSPGG